MAREFLSLVKILIRPLVLSALGLLFCFSSFASSGFCEDSFLVSDGSNLLVIKNHVQSTSRLDQILTEKDLFHFTKALSLDPELARAFEVLGFDFFSQPFRYPTWLELFRNFSAHMNSVRAKEVLYPALTFRNKSDRSVIYYSPGLDPVPTEDYEFFEGQLTHDEFVAGLSNNRFPVNFLALHDISHLVGYIQEPDGYMANLQKAFRTRSSIESSTSQAEGIYSYLHFSAELLSLPKSEKMGEINSLIGFDPKTLQGKEDSVETIIEQYRQLSQSEILEMASGIISKSFPLIKRLGGIVANPPEVQMNAGYIGPHILNKVLGQERFDLPRKTGDKMAYASILFMPYEIQYLSDLFLESNPQALKQYNSLGLTKERIFNELTETLARFHWSMWFGARFVSVDSLMNDILFSSPKDQSSSSMLYFKGIRGEHSYFYRVLFDDN